MLVGLKLVGLKLVKKYLLTAGGRWLLGIGMSL
jgi:hypothetical protein